MSSKPVQHQGLITKTSHPLRVLGKLLQRHTATSPNGNAVGNGGGDVEIAVHPIFYRASDVCATGYS